MILFYSDDIVSGVATLPQEEAVHCVRVLRHKTGDEVNIIDGKGTLYRCRLVSDSAKCTQAAIEESFPLWGAHGYNLTLAVCPTKNPDRYEWFAEKATEMGVDRIVPVFGEHSERRVFKGERLRKILLSAAKQSLKAAIPALEEPSAVKDFIISASDGSLNMIACCFEDETHPRRSVKEVLQASDKTDISILIGPEGDFSPEELRLALDRGFVPVHLGNSRLRTETAAVTACAAVYLNFL